MNVLLAHPGTQHSFRLARELERHRVLAAFYTGMAIPAGGWSDRAGRCLPARWRSRLANRRLTGVPAARLHCRPRSELAAIWRSRRDADAQRVWHQRATSFQRSIPRRAIRSASALIGFDTASWILAQRCAELGVPFVLDQSIAHPDAKLAPYELVQRQYPAWTEGVEVRRPDVRAAEQVEHDAATRIVAASAFTRHSLVAHGVDAAKIRVNPYGVDCERFALPDRRAASRPLRFLFVGLVNARKGVPLLLDAWREISGRGAELWIVGRASPQVQSLLPELPGLKYFGPVPHAEVARLMQQCDVFVFPSYFEGFGLVLLEAMACGLPVITTTATAGPDLISAGGANGGNGWVVAPGEIEPLIEAMTFFLEHRQRLPEMSRAARSTAERFSWSAYGDRWLEILTEASA